MVRPLLIALLTLTAVAWPVAGLGPLPGRTVDALGDPAGDQAASSILDPFLDPMRTSSFSCDPVAVVWTNGGPLPVWPRLDPDGCINRLVDWVIEEVWPWMEVPMKPVAAWLSDSSLAELDDAAFPPSPSDV